MFSPVHTERSVRIGDLVGRGADEGGMQGTARALTAVGKKLFWNGVVLVHMDLWRLPLWKGGSQVILVALWKVCFIYHELVG